MVHLPRWDIQQPKFWVIISSTHMANMFYTKETDSLTQVTVTCKESVLSTSTQLIKYIIEAYLLVENNAFWQAWKVYQDLFVRNIQN